VPENAVLKKLYFHKAASALIINAPGEYITLIGDVAYDTKPAAKKKGSYDFVQVFAIAQSNLEKLVLAHVASGKPDCILWACYPKGTGSIKSDIKRETVWTAFVAAGLEAVTSVSIDDTWTALRARPINR
jgi:hypothetical protein